MATERLNRIKSKVFPEPRGPLRSADLRFSSPQLTLRDHEYGDGASCFGVSVYSPAVRPVPLVRGRPKFGFGFGFGFGRNSS